MYAACTRVDVHLLTRGEEEMGADESVNRIAKNVNKQILSLLSRSQLNAHKSLVLTSCSMHVLCAGVSPVCLNCIVQVG